MSPVPTTASGERRHLVTLDVPNGEVGYLPLDPATWYCAVLNEAAGVATLIGRFHPGITTATRVHLKGRIFHVNAVLNRDERDVELELDCREVYD